MRSLRLRRAHLRGSLSFILYRRGDAKSAELARRRGTQEGDASNTGGLAHFSEADRALASLPGGQKGHQKQKEKSMTPKISLIIGIAAAMGVFAPVATGSTGQSRGLPVETAKPAVVNPLRILHTRIEVVGRCTGSATRERGWSRTAGSRISRNKGRGGTGPPLSFARVRRRSGRRHRHRPVRG